MKLKALVFALLIVACGLGGCGTPNEEAQSTFKTTFSLGSVVEANEQLLLPGPRVSSGSEAGPSEPFTQKSEVTTVYIDSNNVLAFMEAIQSSIQQSLASNNTEILGGGGSAGQDASGNLSEIPHFWFSYRESKMDGAIHVWGVPGEGSSLVLIVTIVEG